MRAATLVLIWIVRVAGVLQILLGLAIWIGPGAGYVSLHIQIGSLIVVCLWILAVVGLTARGRPGLAGFAIVWGLALPAFGMVQSTVLDGPAHWIIRVVHLVMGLIALGTADALAKHILATRR